MKKAIGLISSLLIFMSGVGLTALAADTVTAEVAVTISDGAGALVMTQETVIATDRNNDGAVDLDEVLYAAHEQAYEGGAAAGYASAATQWGLGISKLWGDTSYNYGYYVNHKGASDLSDKVQDGDIVKAYIYQDGTTYSDEYAFFDRETITAEAGTAITLVLKGVEFDASWSPVDTPLANAVITVDGEETAYQTDAQGSVTLQINSVGTHVISAKIDGKILVPPVLTATINEVEDEIDDTENDAEKDETVKSPKTGDALTPSVGMLLILGLAAVILSGKKLYEK